MTKDERIGIRVAAESAYGCVRTCAKLLVENETASLLDQTLAVQSFEMFFIEVPETPVRTEA